MVTNKTIPKEIEEFAKKSIPILEGYDLLPKTIKEVEKDKSKLNVVWIVLAFVLVISATIIFFYLGSTGAFHDIFNQTLNVDPQTNITNLYAFEMNPTTQNDFKNNYTIVNQINCPPCECFCE